MIYLETIENNIKEIFEYNKDSLYIGSHKSCDIICNQLKEDVALKITVEKDLLYAIHSHEYSFMLVNGVKCLRKSQIKINDIIQIDHLQIKVINFKQTYQVIDNDNVNIVLENIKSSNPQTYKLIRELQKELVMQYQREQINDTK